MSAAAGRVGPVLAAPGAPVVTAELLVSARYWLAVAWARGVVAAESPAPGAPARALARLVEALDAAPVVPPPCPWVLS